MKIEIFIYRNAGSGATVLIYMQKIYVLYVLYNQAFITDLSRIQPTDCNKSYIMNTTGTKLLMISYITTFVRIKLLPLLHY